MAALINHYKAPKHAQTHYQDYRLHILAAMPSFKQITDPPHVEIDTTVILDTPAAEKTVRSLNWSKYVDQTNTTANEPSYRLWYRYLMGRAKNYYL